MNLFGKIVPCEPDPSRWEPIETAPTDGTPIIAKVFGDGEDRVILWVPVPVDPPEPDNICKNVARQLRDMSEEKKQRVVERMRARGFFR